MAVSAGVERDGGIPEMEGLSLGGNGVWSPWSR